MWADTEIRRDLIRSWRDEAVELWRELYREPPEPDLEEDPDDLCLESWWMAREASQVEIAISAMDLDFAREIDDICWRNMAEVRILDRMGKVDAIGEVLDLASSIRDPELRAKAVDGVCQGVKTPAYARDLGLLGHALAISARLVEQQNAVFRIVSLLREPGLWRWVDPPRYNYQWLMYAEATEDPQPLRYALELGLLDQNQGVIRRAIKLIAKTGNLSLNEGAFQRLFSCRCDEDRGRCFALLGHGPLGEWAIEFAFATARSIRNDEKSFTDNVFSKVFTRPYLCGYARDHVLAEIAAVLKDPTLTEDMIDPDTSSFTLAQIGIETGNPEPIRALEDYRDRASGLAALGRRQRDERLLLEACQQFEGEEKDHRYLQCLSSLIDVATNPPTLSLPDQIEFQSWHGLLQQLPLPFEV